MSSNKNIIQETSRDFNAISQDLVASMSNITDEWAPADETDPGLVYLKVASMLGDMLSYNRDRGTMSMFPSTVQERQDAYRLFRSLGYQMRWYRSASCNASLSFTDVVEGDMIIIPKFTTFRTKSSGVKYVYVGNNVKTSITKSNQYSKVTIPLLQGEAVTPPIVTLYRAPINNLFLWHSVYGYNVSVSDLFNDVYIRLSNNKVDETSIVLVDDAGEEWKQVEKSVESYDGKYFQLYINNYNGAYIKLSNTPSSLNVKKFKMFYILTNGIEGRISADTLNSYPETPVYKVASASSYVAINSKIKVSNDASVGGYDYETAEEAYLNFARGGQKIDTIVTLKDFETDVLEVDGVAQCTADDVETYTETFYDYLFKFTNSGTEYSRYIPLNNRYEAEELKTGYGECEFWLSSVKVFCENQLVFCGVTTDASSSDTQEVTPYGFPSYTYTFVHPRNTKDTRPKLNSGCFCSFGTDVVYGPYLLVYMCDDPEIGLPKHPNGNYWIEYTITRKIGNVGINVVPDTTSLEEKDFDEIQEDIEEELEDKVHSYLTPYVYSKPYYVYWRPQGSLLTTTVTRYEANQTMTNIDLVFKEVFKDKYMKYNQPINVDDLTENIKNVISLEGITDKKIDYFLPIPCTDEVGNLTGTSITVYPEKIQQQYLSKNINIACKNITPILYTDASDNEVKMALSIYFGEFFMIKPGTLKVDINHGDIVAYDEKVRFQWDGITPYVDAYPYLVDHSKQNYGTLFSESSYLLDNSQVFYDAASCINLTGTIYSEISNIVIVLNHNYWDGKTIDVRVSFETNRNFICHYDGYDPNDFFVDPTSIRSNEL